MGKVWVPIGTVSKARKFGWQRYDDTFDTWFQTFRSFENAGILPLQTPSPTADVKALELRPNPADAVSARLAHDSASADIEQASVGSSDGQETLSSSLDSEITRVDETIATNVIGRTRKSNVLHIEEVRAPMA